MRLAKTVVTERENFVTDLFRTNPDTTVKSAQEALVARYGRSMSLKRLYELSKSARPETDTQ